MSKGRKAPSSFTPATGVNPTPEEVTNVLLGQPALYIMHYRHNDNCRTIRTQRWEDCSCGGNVDHQLVRFNKGAN